MANWMNDQDLQFSPLFMAWPKVLYPVYDLNLPVKPNEQHPSRLLHVNEMIIWILAELQRAKRAREAPWVRKISNPSSRENLVMTSAYERTSFVRPSVRTDSGEGGRGVSRYSSRSPVRETEECYLSLAVVCLEVRKTLISICHVNKRSERLI